MSLLIITVAKTVSLSDGSRIARRRRRRWILLRHYDLSAVTLHGQWNQPIFRDGGECRLPMHVRFRSRQPGFAPRNQRRRRMASATNTTPAGVNIFRQLWRATAATTEPQLCQEFHRHRQRIGWDYFCLGKDKILPKLIYYRERL